MFDPFRNRYALHCPANETRTWTAVSGFRTIRRLRGATAPAVFRVEFDCDDCGGRHTALLAHDRLDWEPIGADTPDTFLNLLTGSRELVASELGELTVDRIRRGQWPWSFWCHPESSMRPGFPSALRFVTGEHDHGDERVGVLVRCFACQRHTVNLVTREHLDVPWHNDARLDYVAQVFDGDVLAPEERFRHQLDAGLGRIRRAG